MGRGAMLLYVVKGFPLDNRSVLCHGFDSVLLRFLSSPLVFANVSDTGPHLAICVALIGDVR